jgi:hypothetical protein
MGNIKQGELLRRESPMPGRTLRHKSLASSVLMCAFLALAYLPVVVASVRGSAKALSCGYQSVGLQSSSPGFENDFAYALIEINSPSTIKAAITDFAVYNQDGNETTFKRVAEVDEVLRGGTEECPRSISTNNDDLRVWNGTLPKGTIRLCVRAAFIKAPDFVTRFRLKIGPYIIQGPVDVLSSG